MKCIFKKLWFDPGHHALNFVQCKSSEKGPYPERFRAFRSIQNKIVKMTAKNFQCNKLMLMCTKIYLIKGNQDSGDPTLDVITIVDLFGLLRWS